MKVEMGLEMEVEMEVETEMKAEIGKYSLMVIRSSLTLTACVL